MREETIIIKCGEVKHRISLIRGSLVLHDHPNMPAEKALIALGGKECECLRILRAWKDAWKYGRFHPLPLEFQRLRDKIRCDPRIRERYMRKNESPKDELCRPVRCRAKDRLEKMAKAELLRCKYRKAVRHLVTVEVFDPTDDRGPFIYGRNLWESRLKNKRRLHLYEAEWIFVDTSTIEVCVPLRWYSRVYKRGLAVVDGCFVVDAIENPYFGTVVLAGRQDPDDGYNIRPVAARIVNGGLEWLS